MVFGGQTYDSGQPMFYFINGETYIDTAPMVIRMEVRPLPGQITTGNVSCFFAPPVLSADADHPRLPADMANRIFLPILRARWAMTYKKYSGNNIKNSWLLAKAREATKGTEQQPAETAYHLHDVPHLTYANAHCLYRSE